MLLSGEVAGYLSTNMDAETIRRLAFSSVAVVIGLTVLLNAALYVKRWFRTWFYLRKIGGPYCVMPLIFNIITHKNFMHYTPVVDYTVSLFNMFVGFSKVFKKHYAYYLGFTPFVIIYSKEGMEALLSHQENINKGDLYELLVYWLGRGLLISKKEKWKVRRRLLTPAFHFRILEDILPVMSKEATTLAEKLGRLSKNGPVSIMSEIQLCTLSIICETAMGVEIKAQENKDSPYVKAVMETGESFMYRMMNPYLWSNAVFHYLTPYGWKIKRHTDLMRKFSLNVIEKRKRALLLERSREENLDPQDEEQVSNVFKNRKSFIDILLEVHFDNDNFAIDHIREEVDTFMFEGHDTTSVGVTFALYFIGLYQDVQEKMYEELQSILGPDTDRPFTSEDIKEMKYIECVLKESQRIYPSVPIVARIIDEDFNIDGDLIPKGSNVNIFIYALHQDPSVFPNPEKFDPDRFLPENTKGRSPYAFVPFSAGSRNCIGQKFALMEEKVIVATLLRKFRIKSVDPRDRINLVAELVLRPKSDVRLQFIPRT